MRYTRVCVCYTCVVRVCMCVVRVCVCDLCCTCSVRTHIPFSLPKDLGSSGRCTLEYLCKSRSFGCAALISLITWNRNEISTFSISSTSSSSSNQRNSNLSKTLSTHLVSPACARHVLSFGLGSAKSLIGLLPVFCFMWRVQWGENQRIWPLSQNPMKRRTIDEIKHCLTNWRLHRFPNSRSQHFLASGFFFFSFPGRSPLPFPGLHLPFHQFCSLGSCSS